MAYNAQFCQDLASVHAQFLCLASNCVRESIDLRRWPTAAAIFYSR